MSNLEPLYPYQDRYLAATKQFLNAKRVIQEVYALTPKGVSEVFDRLDELKKLYHEIDLELKSIHYSIYKDLGELDPYFKDIEWENPNPYSAKLD